MSTFLLDLWHDLRQKRLWPVAAALLVALVAVPLLLLKPASSGGEPDPTTAGATAAPGAGGNAPAVALAEEGPGGSDLDTFDSADPFEVPVEARPSDPTAPALPGADESAEAGSGASGEGSASSGSGSAGFGSSGSVSPGSGSGSGSSGSTQGSTPGSGGTGGSGGSGGRSTAPRERYSYTVDVRFGRRGKARSYRALQRVETLPTTGSPLLVFLGVTGSGKTAVFLVSDTLGHRGEGLCRPKPSPERPACGLLYLRDDGDHDQHFFKDASGRLYDMRLTDIDLRPVGDREAASLSRERARRSARARRRDGTTAQPLPSPTLTDEVR